MHEEDGFQQNPFGKSLFHLLTDWCGNGPAGQFLQMESVLRTTQLATGLVGKYQD